MTRAELIAEPPGRRDWDYVAFDDYEKDTKELVDQASGIIAQQRAEIDQLQILILLLVEAAGGRLAIDICDIEADPRKRLDLIREIDHRYRQWIFRTCVLGSEP